MTATIEFSLLRARSGISIEDFADLAGFSRRTVYRWESGAAAPRLAAVRLLKTMVRKGREVPPGGAEGFRFIDLFAGIGGLRRGFDELGGQRVFTSEWDRYSQQTYLANFDCEHEVAGDITAVPVGGIPAHDLLPFTRSGRASGIAPPGTGCP